MEERPVLTHQFHSDDPDEVSDFIGKIYANNQFNAQHAGKRNVNMGGREWNGVGIYDVDYQMPFNFNSSGSRPNYLFLSCNRGEATYFDGRTETGCRPSDVMPISSTGESNCITGAEGFGHLSVIIDAEKTNSFLERWVGHPLETPVKFDLSPLSPDAAAQWNISAQCLHQMMQMSPIPSTAAEALTEHMLAALATNHPHNYSELLLDGRHAPEHQTRIAMRMIMDDPMRWKTLSVIAHSLGCATNALDRGIRRYSGRTAAELFYEARLIGTNRTLARSDGYSFVSSLQRYGFSISARFVRDYTRRFGEPPSATYRRNANAADINSLSKIAADLLCERTINEFVDASLGKPIGLADLARLVGMTEISTISAFKERFSRTPMQYVIERRLERARWLLTNTSDSILAIAIECGFTTQSYLTTSMKKHFGATPKQIRDRRN